MESQSAMFEVVSRSGSTSSDSIVNISRSGASSIVTSSTTTTPDEDKLKTEVEQLRADKKILEGRIRGFKTLNDLLLDYRKENDQLKSQLKALKVEPLVMPSSDLRASAVSNPFSLVSLQAAQNQSSTTMLDISQLTLQDQKISSLDPLARSTPSLNPKGPPVSYPPVSGPPSSLQETVGPPEA